MREKLKHRLYLLKHSLMSRWMQITCLIILPVNIFAILSVYSMSNATYERLVDRLNHQLTLFAQDTENDLQFLRTEIISNVLPDQMLALSGGDQLDSILTDLRLKNALAGMHVGVSGYVACYLYDRSRDFATFFQRQTSLDEAVLHAGLESLRNLNAGNASGTHVLRIGDQTLLFVDYVFPYFSFGYILDAREILRVCYERSAENVGTVFLSDADGTVLAAYPASPRETVPMTTSGLFSREIAVQAGLDSLTVRLTCYVSASEVRHLYPLTNTIAQILAVFSILVIPLLYLFARSMIYRPLTALWEGMQRVEDGELDYRVPEHFGTIQMDYLAKRFNQMTGEIRHMRITSYEQEIGKLQTETINAHLQVNQHMLINSLNVVYSLIQMKRYAEASEFTVLLIKYFQYALRKNSHIVTVREEMAFIEDYIRLQKIRLKDKFTSVCQVTEEARDQEIPQLMIQGFVENAIKYAIVPDRTTEILIDVHLQDKRLLVSVIDTGNGIAPDKLSALQEGQPVVDETGKHVGLWNARKRLDYYYGHDYQLKIVSDEGSGTMIHMSLPLHPGDTASVIHDQKQNDVGENRRAGNDPYYADR